MHVICASTRAVSLKDRTDDFCTVSQRFVRSDHRHLVLGVEWQGVQYVDPVQDPVGVLGHFSVQAGVASTPSYIIIIIKVC